MFVVSEQTARELVGIDAAVEAVEAVFAALGRGEAVNYPVVREGIGHADAVFGVKSGFDRSGMIFGLKAGGYWPGNAARHGIGNHQSVVVLFDQETGRATAVVSGNYLTGVRTAAASALAARHLARPNPRTLGIIGAGVQGGFQVRGMKALFGIETVVASDLDAARLEAFGEDMAGLGVAFEALPPAEVVARADILVTVTPSTSPHVSADWVRPGTHVSALGADTRGKQELDVELVASASVFTDDAEQATTIGECQHAHAAGRLTLKGTLGELINGAVEGRTSEDEITLYDGTGIALQDLAVAELALRIAREKGVAQEVAY